MARVPKRLGRFEVLVIDDIGYVEQSREEIAVLFTLFADRYDRGSIIEVNIKSIRLEAALDGAQEDRQDSPAK